MAPRQSELALTGGTEYSSYLVGSEGIEPSSIVYEATAYSYSFNRQICLQKNFRYIKSKKTNLT